MPGFIVNIGEIKSFPGNQNLGSGMITMLGGLILDTGINKFTNDNCFYETDSFIVVLAGVILNKKEFCGINEPWETAVIRLYTEKGNDFYTLFRGSFSGLIYDKHKDKWIIFVDHIGSKHVYYSKLSDSYIFSSDIDSIYEYYKVNGLSLNLSKNSAYMLLSYGYMLEDNTLSESIKKILPGNYIKIEKGSFSIHEYFRLTNYSNYNLDEKDAIEEMDHFFRQAIIRQFEKDKEYGYQHLVGLSGGLDSRMTSWVAHEMGYTNQLNFTFSQSGYLDETIPRKIAADLKHEWIFKALDNGLFLTEIDSMTRITGGNLLYYGIAHILSLLKLINFSNLGIVHSGQLGDVVFGTFYKSRDKNQRFAAGDGAYSKRFVHKVDHSSFENKYENQEISNFYQRGFAGANYGLLAPQQFTETMSPFYDIDLMMFSLTIPVELRFYHKIYKEWILKKYPQAAKYIWEKSKSRITSKNFYAFKRSIPYQRILPIVLHKLGLKVYGINSPKHMNPLGYWLNTNHNLRDFITGYYNENIRYIDDDELRKDITQLFYGDNVIEKVEALTLLSAVKRFHN